jgi:restriction system protein
MATWLVRAGRRGEAETYNLEHGLAVIGFTEMGDASQANTPEAIAALVKRSLEPGASGMRVSTTASQLHAFVNRMQKDDLVVMPLKRQPQVAIGRIDGPYAFRTEMGAPHHVRQVKWLRSDIPRTAFGPDLLASLGSLLTICQLRRNGADTRLRAMADGKPDPGAAAAPSDRETPSGDTADDPNAATLDLERAARDQIQAHIAAKFTSHRLADLVDAVLRADGYVTEVSPPGPDGGVDILAARGALGFDLPRLCVQVKATGTPADVKVLRELMGTMSNFKADQGLFVSWSGYKDTAHREARQSFFILRLWDADDLVNAVFANYEKFDEGIRQELPLKRVWTLVSDA